MSLQFTQYEVERELADIIRRGDAKEIARITHIYDTIVYGMLNADDERKSYAFGFLQIQCALDEIDEQRGEAFFQAIVKFRELSKRRQKELAGNIAHDTGKLSKEVSDCVFSHLQGKPFSEQLTEAIEAKAQIERLIETLVCHIKQEREEIKEQVCGRAN